MTTKPEAIVQIEAALAASRTEDETWHICMDPKAMREVISHIAAQDAEIARLRDALTAYANVCNWSPYPSGIYRIWLEPDSTSPSAYNGFDLARAALTTKGTT